MLNREDLMESLKEFTRAVTNKEIYSLPKDIQESIYQRITYFNGLCKETHDEDLVATLLTVEEEIYNLTRV